MRFIKVTLPVTLVFLMAVVGLAAFFSPHHTVQDFLNETQVWQKIIYGSTVFIGSYSLLKVHYGKIKRQQKGWGYSGVLFTCFALVVTFGALNYYGAWSAADQGVVPVVGRNAIVLSPILDKDGKPTATKEGHALFRAFFAPLDKDGKAVKGPDGKPILTADPAHAQVEQVATADGRGTFQLDPKDPKAATKLDQLLGENEKPLMFDPAKGDQLDLLPAGSQGLWPVVGKNVHFLSAVLSKDGKPAATQGDRPFFKVLVATLDKDGKIIKGADGKPALAPDADHTEVAEQAGPNGQAVFVNLKSNATIEQSVGANGRALFFNSAKGSQVEQPLTGLQGPFVAQTKAFDGVRWMYEGVIQPAGAMTYAMLGFFICSAAVRTLRAKTLEAGVLLLAALIVMLGQVPVAEKIWVHIPVISGWVLDWPNMAVKRAIMFGICVGGIGTSLRVMFGIERSWLGGEEVAVNLSKLFTVDRRIVFVAVFLALLVPLLFPFGMPSTPTANVELMYSLFERAADRGKPVLLSFEFDPTGKAEQEPMARAILRHIFARNGKAVIINKSGGQQGQALHLQIINDCALEFGAVEGVNYVYLPFQVGTTSLVINMGQNFQSAYPVDIRQKALSDIPLTRDIGRLADFSYVMVICNSTVIVNDWLQYAQGPYSLDMGFGTLGSAAPDCYNFINSKQIKGFLGGLVGAAQYEQLLVDHGINLRRQFSAADLAPSMVPPFCRKLLATLDAPVSRHVWNALSDAQKDAVRHSVEWGWFGRGSDQLTPDDKTKVAKALNELLVPPPAEGSAATSRPASQPTTRPGTAPGTQPATQTSTQAASQPASWDYITDADLEGQKIDPKVRATIRKFDADLEPQIRRRLYIESKFPDGLVRAQEHGQATRWMTPQSFAHVALVVAVLLGNIFFLWERRKGKAAVS